MTKEAKQKHIGNGNRVQRSSKKKQKYQSAVFNLMANKDGD